MSNSVDINNITPSLIEAFALQMTPKNEKELQTNRSKFYSAYSFFRYWTAKYKNKAEEESSRWLSEDEEDGDNKIPDNLPRWWTAEDTIAWPTIRSHFNSSSFRYWTAEDKRKMEEDISSWLAYEKGEEEEIAYSFGSPCILKCMRKEYNDPWYNLTHPVYPKWLAEEKEVEDYISRQQSLRPKFNSSSFFFRFWMVKEDIEAEDRYWMAKEDKIAEDRYWMAKEDKIAELYRYRNGVPY